MWESSPAITSRANGLRSTRIGNNSSDAGKDTGLHNLPFHDTAQNRIWPAIAVPAQDLLAWTARLVLPARAATYEPKRLRLWILAVAGRIVRTARQHLLRLGSARPWANMITTAHVRLLALPAL